MRAHHRALFQYLERMGATNVQLKHTNRHPRLVFNWKSEPLDFVCAWSPSDWRSLENAKRELRHKLGFPEEAQEPPRQRRRLEDMLPELPTPPNPTSESSTALTTIPTPTEREIGGMALYTDGRLRFDVPEEVAKQLERDRPRTCEYINIERESENTWSISVDLSGTSRKALNFTKANHYVAEIMSGWGPHNENIEPFGMSNAEFEYINKRIIAYAPKEPHAVRSAPYRSQNRTSAAQKAKQPVVPPKEQRAKPTVVPPKKETRPKITVVPGVGVVSRERPATKQDIFKITTPTPSQAVTTPAVVPQGTSWIVDYLLEHGCTPDNIRAVMLAVRHLEEHNIKAKRHQGRIVFDERFD